MPTIIGDGSDYEPRSLLPVSVDRVLGQVIPRHDDGPPQLDAVALTKLQEHLANVASDSNLDRIPMTAEIDILIDGNKAIAALIEGLRQRLDNKISSEEVLTVLSATR